MARRTTLYFASDLHGSDKCFRKFVNAGPIYGADVMVLGGDVAGKAIQGIIDLGGGRFRCSFRGATHEVEVGTALDDLCRMVADHGFYPYLAEPGELEARNADGSIGQLFLDLMRARLTSWLTLANERLRPKGLPVYWMLGNDDPVELEEVLDAAPWGEHADGRVIELADGHELLSCGWSNETPWHSYREIPEAALEARLRDLTGKLRDPRNAVFNIHVPPYGSGIDDAPVLDAELTVQASGGQAKMAPVGSTAVRTIIEEVQPLLGLHGHIHEASGFRKIGPTLVVNPGSDYSTGTLNGVLVTLEAHKVRAHQFVRG